MLRTNRVGHCATVGAAVVMVACAVEVIWDDSPYPDPRGTAVRFHCPNELAAVGQPGQTSLQSIALRWSVGKGQSYPEDYVYLRLPDDLVSLSLVVDAAQHETAIRRLIHEGNVLLDATQEAYIGETAPFFHEPVRGASILLPMGDMPVPSGGCLAIDPYAIGEYAGETATLHVLSRRMATGTILPVDLVMVADVRMSDAEVDETLRTVDAIYRGHEGPRIGDVEVLHLKRSSSTVALDRPEEYSMRAAFRGDRLALTVYVVDAFHDEPDTLGISGSIPGANGIYGTASTGVIVALSSHETADGGVDWGLLGETIAHEAGHQLGLFHTTEPEGLYHDPLADTPECPSDHDADEDGEVSAEECTTAGGDNFMFWAMREDGPQVAISARQAAILRLNPIVGSGSPRFVGAMENAPAPPRFALLPRLQAPEGTRRWSAQLASRHFKPTALPEPTPRDRPALCFLHAHGRHGFLRARAGALLAGAGMHACPTIR